MSKTDKSCGPVDQASIAAAIQRLGRNAGGYFGERIAIAAVLSELESCAASEGWETGRLSAGPDVALPVFRRWTREGARQIYLSTGIHGDEPAGPLSALELLKENCWPSDANLWLCPCLNPSGFLRNSRESAAGVDLNRDYKHRRSPEVRAHIAWLEQQPAFDLCLCLHEDWEAHGFYVYEVNPLGLPSLANRMVQAVRSICPIDHSAEIDGRPAQDGIIRPVLDPAQRPEWPEAYYLYMNQRSRVGYTLEAPSDFPLSVRVAALATAVKTALAQEG